MANYLHRLKKLEAEHAPISQVSLRFLVEFVNARREAETLLAAGQWFHRATGESGDELSQRARRAVGWDD